MILPARKLIVLMLIPAGVMIVAPLRSGLIFAVAFDLSLLLLTVLDVLVSIQPRDLTVTRVLPTQLSLGEINAAGWDIRNATNRDVTLQLTEDIPDSIEQSQLPMRCRIQSRGRAEIRYRITPTRRGAHEVGDIHLRWPTGMGLAMRQRRIRVSTPVKVYPNVANLTRYEMAARHQRLGELGLIATRHRGAGGIFESLRDYVPGDDLMDIAWKATARRGRLITREYEADRSQNILVVLDCGRHMTTQVDELARIDHAINASIMLTYVAAKQDDYIGMLAFSDDLIQYVPPIKSHMAVSRMNDALYDLEAKLCESDYGQACRFLALQHRKRSLIIIFTDVIDNEASSLLLEHMARFARYHLPLCVTLRNQEIETAARTRPQSPRDCFGQAVAVDLLASRAKALAQMRSHGVDVLDVDPCRLTTNLIDRYLTFKQRQRI